MLRASSAFITITAVMVIAGTAGATVWLVPERFERIQWAIAYEEVHDGDTISVWGPPPGQPPVPPWTYYENVDFQGKSIFVVNRSFIEEIPGYPPSWDHVVIDGTQSGPVVTMTMGDLATVLKGFTVWNGLNTEYGGGVIIHAGSIVKNHIHGNSSEMGGGGIFCDPYGNAIQIYDNLVEYNNSPASGGGLLVWGRPSIDIRRNIIRHNKAKYCGGGVCFSYMLELEPVPLSGDSFTDNVVFDNHLTGPPGSVDGGGIYAWRWPQAARRNVVTDNEHNGIFMVYKNNKPMNLGESDDPGFNVLMRNGDHDLVVVYEIPGPVYPVYAVGNYWGYLDTPTILERIEINAGSVNYDPVAASSKWFDVNRPEGSTCETDVLVTGDLRVSRSLTIEPGKKKFEFSLDPDMSLAGGDPGRTDLIVEGAGTVLTSFGTGDDTILYTSKRNMEPWMPGDWYGIRVRNGAQALFVWSEIRAAYCGIDVAPDGWAQTRWSKLRGCLFAGAYSQQGMLCVQESEVSDNEVYGVRYWMPGPYQDCYVMYSTLNHNGFAGVSFEATPPANDAPHRILYNVIVGGIGGPLAAMYGVEVKGGSNWVSVENNDVSGFHQAGIALWASSPSMVMDQTIGNTVNGIACFQGSNPYVRWNRVDLSQNGVFCDASSFPNLGTEENPGNNSILFGNVVWVHQTADAAIPLMAQLNWWGDINPDEHPEKFIGNIVYFPWLFGPPGGGGGQQSAGPKSSLLETALGRPLPMPMRGTARIPFQVAHAGPVSLDVVDASGRVVRVLVRGERAPGRYNVTWDRADNSGRRMPEGVYFLRFDADARRDVQKVVVMH